MSRSSSLNTTMRTEVIEMIGATDIICRYTSGEAGLFETNTALRKLGDDLAGGLHLEPSKHMIRPEDVGRLGLLDAGDGLELVEICDMTLVDRDCGDQYAICMVGSHTYEVKGNKLEAVAWAD